MPVIVDPLITPMIGGVGSSVPSDGPNAWKVPSGAGDFSALGMTVPDGLWLFQELATPIVDVIGGVGDLAAAGAVTFDQVVPGWGRRGCGIPDAAATGFRRAAGQAPNPATTDLLWLFYVIMGAVPAAARTIICGSDSAAATELQVGHGAGRLFRHKSLAAVTNGAVNINGMNLAPALLNDRTGGRSAGYISGEKINGTYGAGTVDGNKGIGAGVLNAAPMTVVWGACWTAAKARLTDAQVKAQIYTPLNLAPLFV